MEGLPSVSSETAELEGNSSTGRWTSEEHKIFLEGLKLHQKHWKLIADMVKTRTVVQIRTHAQKYFQKLEKSRTCAVQMKNSSNDEENCRDGSSPTSEGEASLTSAEEPSAAELAAAKQRCSLKRNGSSLTDGAPSKRSRSRKSAAARSAAAAAKNAAAVNLFAVQHTPPTMFAETDDMDMNLINLLEKIDWASPDETDAISGPIDGSNYFHSSAAAAVAVVPTRSNVFVPGQSSFAFPDEEVHFKFNNLIKEYKNKVASINEKEKEDHLNSLHLLPRYFMSTAVPPSLTRIDNTFCHYPVDEAESPVRPRATSATSGSQAPEGESLVWAQQHRKAMHAVSFDDVTEAGASQMCEDMLHIVTRAEPDMDRMTPDNNASFHSVTPPSSTSPEGSKRQRGRPLSKRTMKAKAAAAVPTGEEDVTMADVGLPVSPFGPSGPDLDEEELNFDGALAELDVSDSFLENLWKPSSPPAFAPIDHQYGAKQHQMFQNFSTIVSPSAGVVEYTGAALKTTAVQHAVEFSCQDTNFGSGQFEDELSGMLEMFE